MDDRKYMQIALEGARKALEQGEFPVGCIVVCQGKVIADGRRINSRGDATNETDHAEMNALRSLTLQRAELTAQKATLYCTMEPCLMCYGAILLSGITRIVWAFEDAMGGGTACDLSRLTPLYRDAEIEIVPNVMRRKSLILFQNFFQNPVNEYWKGSFLADYTLDQK
ncbi:nucleoside deaminase [Desulfobacterales bacterium HSG17]|nr:nucleoside deaminase [Desulfobacterales bacterium HSG17]